MREREVHWGALELDLSIAGSRATVTRRTDFVNCPENGDDDGDYEWDKGQHMNAYLIGVGDEESTKTALSFRCIPITSKQTNTLVVDYQAWWGLEKKGNQLTSTLCSNYKLSIKWHNFYSVSRMNKQAAMSITPDTFLF